MKTRVLKLLVLFFLPPIFAVISCAGGTEGGCSPIIPVPSGCQNMDWQHFQLPPGPPVGIHVLLPKFECAQEPTETRCCPPSDLTTEFDEQACCEAFMSIMAARPEAQRNLYPPPPMSASEAAQYAAACTVPVPPGPEPGPEPVPALRVQCRCDNAEDKIASCSTEDTDCCFPITKQGTPTSFTCDLELAEGTVTTAGLTKDQLLSNMQTLTVVWSLAAGSQLPGVDGVPSPGPASGVTPLKTVQRTLATEPLETAFHGLAPIPYGGQSATENVETSTIAYQLLALSGQNQGSGSDDIRFGLEAQGACGCALGADPKNALGNLLVGMMLVSIPFLLRRRAVRVVRKR